MDQYTFRYMNIILFLHCNRNYIYLVSKLYAHDGEMYSIKHFVIMILSVTNGFLLVFQATSNHKIDHHVKRGVDMHYHKPYP